MAGREIDWASAEVRDGTLSVAIAGEDAKQWNARMQAVLHLLDRGGGRWGEITVAKSKVKVAEVRAGSESELRHLLDSAVVQVNADLAPPDESRDGEDEQRGSDDERTDDDGQADADRQATEAFRAFGRSGSADEKGAEGEGDGDSQASQRSDRESGRD